MKIVFMGTPDFAVRVLEAIMESRHEVAAVVTVPDRPTGRGLKLTPSAVKCYADEHKLPILQPEKLRDPQFLAKLESYKADLFVVVAFRMLPQIVWAMPPMGTFNLHASLLPQYRGAAPINWAIINGETHTGVTTFMLNEHIDEGKILLQKECKINADDNAGTLHDRLAEIGSQLVVNTLDGLEAGSLIPQPQQKIDNLKPAPKIFKDDTRIDWYEAGKQIVDKIRGLSPYPAATTKFVNEMGQTIDAKIFDAIFTPTTITEAVPKLESDGKREIKVHVKDGNINILSIQISGKRRVAANELLRGYNVKDWKLGL